MTEQSFRSKLLTRRTYSRPIEDSETLFETWPETIDRVIHHQRWLWERAAGRPLDLIELTELEQLRKLMHDRKALPSGRTLWLGGTDVAMTREASQFNCSFGKVETVFDVVDAFWLLLQGCGVGFTPVTGQLNGFTQYISDIEIIPSKGLTTKGREENVETVMDGVWTISVGDSAEAWAKAAGKLMARSSPVHKLVLDFSEIRAPGIRLKGYGWISSGDLTISKAFEAIAQIRNNRIGEQLKAMDIHDVMNWLGTTLSSRRSAEVSLLEHLHEESEDLAMAKSGDYWEKNPQRAQSNNSLIFWHKPTKLELRGLFHRMLETGGSEPGFINGTEAKRRAPWFQGVNPCAEILLGHKSFCNLVEVDISKFDDDDEAWDAIYLITRANYRQTCVDLRDGVLSDAWHELNGFLRLCGGGLTGIVKWLDKMGYDESWDDEIDFSHPAPRLEEFQAAAQCGANDMAHDLGLPRARAVTTVKPSGTLGKVMDTTEGAHRPLGKYIFNNVNFSNHDPLVDMLKAANYYTFPNPYDATSTIVRLPVSYEGVEFDKVSRPVTNWPFDEQEFNEMEIVEVNQESAVSQLKRYKLLMDNYVDHNCSITVSYDPSEVGEIVEWLNENWDSYVGVSWLLRQDASATAADLGYPYLPQEVVTKEVFEEYSASLLYVDLDQDSSHDMVETGECAGGACPIR